MQQPLKWKLAQKAELIWWKRYLNPKDKDNYYNWKKNYWKGVMEKLPSSFQPKVNQTVLDAGCGPAGIFTIFPENKVVAFDPLMNQYKQDLLNFMPEDFPNVEFIDAPLEAFQYDQQFDFVFCMNAINHVADIQLAFKKLVEQVKPGGYLVVTIDAHNYSFYKHLFRMLPGDILHPHQYNLEEYNQFLIKENLTPEPAILLKKEYFFNHLMLFAQKLV